MSVPHDVVMLLPIGQQCKSAETAIAEKFTGAHVPGMPSKPHQQLPPAIFAEMRPERIGYRLMLLREALDLRPAEISDMLGIDRTYWSRFEGGKRPISDPVAALLVDRFGVTLDFLILGRWDKLPLDLAEKMRAVQRKVENNSGAST